MARIAFGFECSSWLHSVGVKKYWKSKYSRCIYRSIACRSSISHEILHDRTLIWRRHDAITKEWAMCGWLIQPDTTTGWIRQKTGRFAYCYAIHSGSVSTSRVQLSVMRTQFTSNAHTQDRMTVWGVKQVSKDVTKRDGNCPIGCDIGAEVSGTPNVTTEKFC